MIIQRHVRLSIFAWLSLLATSSYSAALKHPDWHPDGELLIAEGSCDGGADLYLVDVLAGTVRKLSENVDIQGYPRWFPDGKRIAFHQIDRNKVARLVIAEVSVDGQVSNATILTDGPFDIEPAPSPDGRMIAYSTSGENGQDVALLSLDGQYRKTWATPYADQFPSWSPDGKSIVYHAKTHTGMHVLIRQFDDDTATQSSPLTDSDRSGFVGHLDASASRLVYSSERDDDRELYLRDLDSGIDTRLTRRDGRDGYPKFSNDGNRVAYHSQVSDDETVIRIMNLDDRGIVQYSCTDLEK